MAVRAGADGGQGLVCSAGQRRGAPTRRELGQDRGVDGRGGRCLRVQEKQSEAVSKSEEWIRGERGDSMTRGSSEDG